MNSVCEMAHAKQSLSLHPATTHNSSDEKMKVESVSFP